MFPLPIMAHIIKWVKKRFLSILYILGPVLRIGKAKKNRRKPHSWGTKQNIVESISHLLHDRWEAMGSDQLPPQVKLKKASQR